MATSPSSSADEPGPKRDPTRSLALLLLLQLVLGAALLTWVALGRPVPGLASPSSSQAPRATVDRFDGARAFALLRRQVTVYGPRPAGSTASKNLSRELRTLLPGGTLQPVPGGLRNVVATLPGTGRPVVIGAHYDTEASVPGHVGANDGAAGTAAVVELARVLRHVDRGAGAPPLTFVLFDGEEEPKGTAPEDFERVALRGSKVHAASAPAQGMILLDYIAERHGFSIPREQNSDPALWRRLRVAAERVGTSALFPPKMQGGIIDDHVPYLRAGVPAIDLIDFDYPQRDTTSDDLDHVSARSLDAVGETVLELLRRW